MTPSALSGIIFVLTLSGIFLGSMLRRTLPKHHLSEDAQDTVRLGVGLIATIAALVLGLLIAAAKGSFDTQNTQIKQITADLILLDNILAQYGPEARPIRQQMRGAVGPFADQLWREKQTSVRGPYETNAQAERVYLEIQGLSPQSDLQRALQSRAAQLSNDIAQTRLLLFVESDSLVPAPLSGNPGVLARYHICKLQPVFAAERDGVHLPFAVCLISRMRDLPDFGTKPTIHWPVDDFERAAAKRPRLALTADIVALLDASRARRALWPQA